MDKIMEIDGLVIHVERRNVKNLNLYVKPPQGEILATVPRRMSEAKVMEFLLSRKKWMEHAVKKVRERNRQKQEEAALPFTDREIQALKDDILKYASKWEPVMGVRCTKWQIREMKTRWGSCTVNTGQIRINLRLAKKPEVCLEYVVVHELCHLLEPSHNQRFHSLMDGFLPDWRDRKALLEAV